MSDPRLYDSDTYVVLESDQPEQFLTAEELLAKLQIILGDRPAAEMPQDLQRFSTLNQQAQHLLETSCELDLGPGQFLQWYAVRLEKSPKRSPQ